MTFLSSLPHPLQCLSQLLLHQMALICVQISLTQVAVHCPGAKISSHPIPTVLASFFLSSHPILVVLAFLFFLPFVPPHFFLRFIYFE